MSTKELIESVRSALNEAEKSGLTNIQISTVKSILNDLEKQSGNESNNLHPLEIEKFRSDLAGSLAYQEQVHSWNLEGFKQVISLGQSALKSMMLTNGGAAVALLAFVGNVASRGGSSETIIAFSQSMQIFVFGVFLAAVAYATTYLSQLFYSGDKKW